MQAKTVVALRLLRPCALTVVATLNDRRREAPFSNDRKRSGAFGREDRRCAAFGRADGRYDLKRNKRSASLRNAPHHSVMRRITPASLP